MDFGDYSQEEARGGKVGGINSEWIRQAWRNVINCMSVDSEMTMCMNVNVISVKSFTLKAGNFPQSETVLDKSRQKFHLKLMFTATSTRSLAYS